jgi:ankyrin repeat protein
MAKRNHVEVGRALIAAGADVNLRVGGYPSGATPLMAAAATNSIGMLELLLRHGANVNAGTGIQPGWPTALGYAIDAGHLACVEALLQDGAAIDRRDLERAILNGNLKVARELLHAGADPRWTFYGGSTALETRSALQPTSDPRWSC